MLKITLKPAKLTPYQLRSLNLLRIHGHPVHPSRGVKLLLSTICASHRTLKSADFIGAYLQAKVIGRHFIRLPLEYAYYFPEYAKYFEKPALLNKGIYGLVYSGKHWNIEFSEWLYSKGFIQSQSEPSYFVFYNKHNQWLRLLFFVDDMLYAGSNDAIKTEFEESVRNRFDVNFLDLHNGFCRCVSTNTKAKPTLLINIATFSTPYNDTILIPNSLNVKHHSHQTTHSVKTTDQ